MRNPEEGEAPPLGAEGERMLMELTRQVAEGARRGDGVVVVRLSDDHAKGFLEFCEAGPFLQVAAYWLDSLNLPKSVSMVRIHWPAGWGVDSIEMQPSN